LPGNAIQISAKNDDLFAVTRYYQVMRWNGNAWQIVNNRVATHVAAQGNGNARAVDPHIFNTQNEMAFWENQKWTGNNPAFGYNINGLGSLHVGLFGCVHDWAGKWTTFGTECNALQVAEGVHSDANLRVRFMIDLNTVLYRWNVGSKAWVKEPLPAGMGNPIYVDVQDETKIVVVDDLSSLWLYDGSLWGKAALDAVQATVGSKAIYYLNAKGRIIKLAF
jgi:hypothetical protein